MGRQSTLAGGLARWPVRAAGAVRVAVPGGSPSNLRYNEHNRIVKPSGQGEGEKAQFPIGGRARERECAGSGETPEPTVKSG